MKRAGDGSTVRLVLEVVGDLMRGARHSRHTMARATGRSLPTVDRWMVEIAKALPNIRHARDDEGVWIFLNDARELRLRRRAAR